MLVPTPGNGQVLLNWSPAATAAFYTVKRSTTEGGPYSNLTPNPTATTFTDTTAANSTNYFYVVTASNAGGESPSSAQASAMPSLPPPTGLAATPASNQVTLTWNTVTNATSYTVGRATAMAGPFTDLTPSPTATSFVDSTALNGTTYYYRVRANDATSSGPNSGTVSATPPGGVAAPSNLGATINNGTVALTWSDNSTTETGFRIERKLNAGAYSTLQSVGVNVVMFNDSTATAIGTYTYRVIATGSPESAPSNEMMAILGNPAVDAYVRGGTNGGANFGAATTLEVKTDPSAPNNQRNSFTRFSMTGVQTTVLSAKLRLYGNAVTSAKDTSVFSVSSITWVETGTGSITWNNQPAMSVMALSTVNVATTAAYREWDVTSYIQQQKAAGATAISLGVKSAVSSTQGQTVFNSRENAANKPILVITSRP
jgi:fibronectin type 3 domain-containing protein